MAPWMDPGKPFMTKTQSELESLCVSVLYFVSDCLVFYKKMYKSQGRTGQAFAADSTWMNS